MSGGNIKGPAVIDVTDEERAAARSNIADRCRARGEYELAASFERGEQDAGWAMRHELAIVWAGNQRGVA